MNKTLQMPGEYILTFPGSYHAGFSTGLNIGEAVNFVSKSWLKHGFECQDIYRKSREKIPVFPIEWLIIENIRNVKKANIDMESKVLLRDHFKKILKDERKARDIMESAVRDGGDKHNKVVFLLMANRENVAEDSH